MPTQYEIRPLATDQENVEKENLNHGDDERQKGNEMKCRAGSGESGESIDLETAMFVSR